MKNLLFIIITTAVLSTYAQNPIDISTIPPDFAKLSYDEAKKVVYSVDWMIATGAFKPNPEYISNVVSQIRSGRLSKGSKILAIFLLGESRTSDTNAIEVLIENIDLMAPNWDREGAGTRLPGWGLYPAEEALLKTGKPTVNPILDHLPTETNQLRRQLMCDVLRQACQCK